MRGSRRPRPLHRSVCSIREAVLCSFHAPLAFQDPLGTHYRRPRTGFLGKSQSPKAWGSDCGEGARERMHGATLLAPVEGRDRFLRFQPYFIPPARGCQPTMLRGNTACCWSCWHPNSYREGCRGVPHATRIALALMRPRRPPPGYQNQNQEKRRWPVHRDLSTVFSHNRCGLQS